jgi:acetyl-CoA acetyltransferase
VKKAGLEIKDIARFEINEAFSAVIRAIEKILGLDPAKVNPDGCVPSSFLRPVAVLLWRLMM